MDYKFYKKIGFKERLILINISIFLLSLLLPLINLGASYSDFNPIQLFTYQYLHGSFEHLFFNMLSLFFLWYGLEPYMDNKRILLLYTICGISSAISQHIFGYINHDFSPLIGASGSIFGLFGANYIYNKDQKMLLFFIIPIRMSVLFPILMCIELLLGLFTKSSVGHIAHFMGGLTGILLTKFLK